MSVQKRTTKRADGKTRTSWRVRWQDGDRWRSRTFDLKRDADLFDGDLRRRRQLGTLAELDAGNETLDRYVVEIWTPTRALALAPRTRRTYAALYDKHISPHLGSIPLRGLTPEVIARWQTERLATGAGPVAVRQALKLLGTILQSAYEAGRLASNPQRVVRKARLPRREEVRPLAPTSVEAVRANLSARDATLVSLIAYAGLRPSEALALRWQDVRDKTILVERSLSLGDEEAGATKTGVSRTVRLLAPLASDLREWRMRSGRPTDEVPVIPSARGDHWLEEAYKAWRRQAFHKACVAAGVDDAHPYALRHTFASLLLHQRLSVIYVARQLGHSAQLTLSTYGHVMDELEDSPGVDAETAIKAARESLAAHKLPTAKKTRS